MSADRSGCWCADKRQPCSYHEGWGDAEDVCAVEIDGLSAELAAAYEDADRLAARLEGAIGSVMHGMSNMDCHGNACNCGAHNALRSHAALRSAGES